MKKKIVVFYTAWTEGVKKIVEAGKGKEREIWPVHYSQLSLKAKKKEILIEAEGRDLKEAGLFYFRSIGDKNEWLPILLELAGEQGIPVVDEYLTKPGGAMRKRKGMEAYLLKKAGVEYADSFYASDREVLKRETKGGMVLKSSKGRHGLGTFLIKKEEEIERLFQGRTGSFLVQEYIPNDGDWRIFVIGGEVVGAFKRAEKDKERVVLNRSVGQSEVRELPEEIRLLVKKAVEVLGIEVAGVDVVVDERDGKAKIIEVNQAPEFGVMEKKTGIDIGEKIIEYLLKKMG